MKKNWPTTDGYWRDSSNAMVIPYGEGYRVGIVLFWHFEPNNPSSYLRSIIYNESGSPMLAWRSTKTGCGVGIPQLTGSHVWLSTVTFPEMKVAFDTYDHIAHATEARLIPAGFQAIDGSEELFSTWAANGRLSSVYDRISEKTYTYGEGRNDIVTDLPRIAGNGAFFRCAEGIADYGACGWDRGTGQFSMLIPPTNTQVIPGIGSDGERLIWFVATKPQQADYAWTKAEIWSSPFATTPGALKPTKIADSPPIAYPTPFVNDGYLAFVGVGSFIHVYRLSDMRHWTTRAPVEQTGTSLSMIYIDSKTVWYMNEGLLVKQELSALGPGEPG